MHCQEINARLGAFLDGELDAQNSQEIAQHLKTCEHCQKEWAELAQLNEQARSALKIDRPEEYWDRLPGRIVARINDDGVLARHTSPRRRLVMVYRFAGLAAIAVLIFAVSRQISFAPDKMVKSVPAPAISEADTMALSEMSRDEAILKEEGKYDYEVTSKPEIKELATVREDRPQPEQRGGGQQLQEVSISEPRAKHRLAAPSTVVESDATSKTTEGMVADGASVGDVKVNEQKKDYPKEEDESQKFYQGRRAGGTAFRSDPRLTSKRVRSEIPGTKAAESFDRNAEPAGFSLMITDTLFALQKVEAWIRSGEVDNDAAAQTFYKTLNTAAACTPVLAKFSDNQIGQENFERRKMVLQVAGLFYNLTVEQDIKSLQPSALSFYNAQREILADSLGIDEYKRRCIVLSGE